MPFFRVIVGCCHQSTNGNCNEDNKAFDPSSATVTVIIGYGDFNDDGEDAGGYENFVYEIIKGMLKVFAEGGKWWLVFFIAAKLFLALLQKFGVVRDALLRMCT